RGPVARHRGPWARRPRRSPRRRAALSKPCGTRDTHAARAASPLSERAARSDPSWSDRQPNAGERAWCAGEQRLWFVVQESVEKGEQIGTFGRKRRGAVDVSHLSSDRLHDRRVHPHELRGEEGKIAEGEMASAFDVDGVVGPAHMTP